jgi:hypothetical protein
MGLSIVYWDCLSGLLNGIVYSLLGLSIGIVKWDCLSFIGIVYRACLMGLSIVYWDCLSGLLNGIVYPVC